ncbi:heavy metal translocating P-type ATPase [soil metagenome]
MSDPVSLRQHLRSAVASSTLAAATAAAGFASGLALELSGAPTTWAHTAYLVGIAAGGWRPGRDGLRALGDRRLEVDLLMVAAAVAAVALDQWRDAALLIVIFATSGALEAAAEARTAAGVRALLVDAPDRAERLLGATSEGATEQVPVDKLTVGDRVVVRQGARVPADGRVLDGEAAVDESSLSGEPLPVRKVEGRPVLAGSSVTEGWLVAEVTVEAADSVLARLAAAVEEAVAAEPPTQQLVARFEQRYAVGVVVAAVAVAALGPTLLGWTGTDTVIRTMTFLVVASPCAVVLATMPATLSALAAAARHRVLVRGGVVLDRLADLDVAALDKTGTVTFGEPEVADVVGFGVVPEDDLLAWAAAAERWSEHPIGRAIVAEAERRGVAVPAAGDVQILASRGVAAQVGGRRVLVGGPTLVGPLPASETPGTLVGVQVDGLLAGQIVVRDRVRAEAPCTIACLAGTGCTDTLLLTGDAAAEAEEVARLTGIGAAHHGLLPHEKAERVRDLLGAGHRVAYVGDGVNDAAALATASVGVSLGQRGTALAVDAADVVIIDDDLHRLPDVIDLARRTRRIVVANLAFALCAIAVLVALSLSGTIPLLVGVIAHEGSSVAVALNGLRLLRWQPPGHDRTT